ncbi:MULTISPECIES: wax ester/triacylglycerol synthase domain-containing protein [unclassified Microbacterium]|uniref:wax ester/triacylglycerol synthase domain-containing protein n=1 Tax=unclassified Microbacterium TaxID=2609290 RepID=UPI00214CA715|nr:MULTISPECIES: wax ester/triacylglycerol synthase domain-containing protein [unclassified Microbacterium]MCR2784607.1 WS/DGAT domain-containing protein [Microbacterium sp. zg.B96]MDL5350474.1 wax ester/triacylglycerol synthase family O-acyltransferase [Microbacterium sp. zg-YB36]WIM14586.1 wax ester/triacylglycerol synthase family O-acyltransferase [Microbacterium sp. zg-B96]
MPWQTLARVDAANLVLDHAGQVNVFLIAGVAEPGGFLGGDGSVDLALLRADLAERVVEIPELRQVLATDRRGRHGWSDRAPDLDAHVRLLPPLADLGDLQQRCAQLMSEPLPRDRPLWELLLLPGAGAGRAAFILRIHHAIADGAAAVQLVRRLFAAPGARDAESPPAVADDRSATPWDVRRALVALRRIVATVAGRGTGATVLTGERSATHGVAFCRADVATLRARGAEHGATVNDVLLSAVAAGYRALLTADGLPAPREVTVSIPVALARRGAARNQVGVMLVALPLSDMTPEARLAAIAARTRREKVQARAQGTLELMRGPIGARIMDRVAARQTLVDGFVTDVPGPRGALSLAGAPVLSVWPVAVLAANVRLGVAAVSYRGSLWCGIHFDAGHVHGETFATAMRADLAAAPPPTR